MNFFKKIIFLILLAAVSILYIPAQVNQTNDASGAFDMTDFPQWTKDLRRWEIVAFGSIPFTMFTATFLMDMHRWRNANGLDLSDEGRRYAPWPFKSAGAVLMDNKEQELVFVMAASLSVAVALADQIIVQVKRYKARKRAESLPVGTTIITRKPWAEEPIEDQDGNITDEAADSAEP